MNDAPPFLQRKVCETRGEGSTTIGYTGLLGQSHKAGQGTGVTGREGSQDWQPELRVKLQLLTLTNIYCSVFQTDVSHQWV